MEPATASRRDRNESAGTRARLVSPWRVPESCPSDIAALATDAQRLHAVLIRKVLSGEKMPRGAMVGLLAANRVRDEVCGPPVQRIDASVSVSSLILASYGVTSPAELTKERALHSAALLPEGEGAPAAASARTVASALVAQAPAPVQPQSLPSTAAPAVPRRRRKTGAP